jgi:hypothetical protein
MVREISIAGMEARAFEDPHVLKLLSDAGLQAPSRPSLLIIGSADLQMVSGLAMRRRLAGVIGWRRSGTIARLLATEWRARLARSAGSHAPSRRGVIGGAIAGMTGWALTSGAAAASPRPGAGEPAIKVADPDDVTRLLATASAQQAIRNWGPVEREALEVTHNSQPVLVLTHPANGMFTFVDHSPRALRGGNPMALSIGPSPSDAPAMRYYSADGVPLADMAVSNGHVTVTAVRDGTSEIEPDVKIPTGQIACFIACLQGPENASCVMNCYNCAHHPLNCVQCVLCAGPPGVRCAKQCFGKVS